jgi:hypothetical protein
MRNLGMIGHNVIEEAIEHISTSGRAVYNLRMTG